MVLLRSNNPWKYEGAVDGDQTLPMALPSHGVGIQAEISTPSSGAHFLGLPEPFETYQRCIIRIGHSILRLFKTRAMFLKSRAPVVINCVGCVLLP